MSDPSGAKSPGSTMFIVTQVAPYPHGPAGVHGVLPQAAVALAELAERAAMTPWAATDVADIPADALSSGGVLALFTIGETPWSAAQRHAVTDAVRQGRLGVLAVHSATDASTGWPEYQALVGARFDGHPWTADFDVDVVDAQHPATVGLTSPWPWHDEVYLFRDLRPDVHVLLRVGDGQLDMSVPGARVPPWGMPLAWCFEEGRGRCFYSALGHFPLAWETPLHLGYLEGALSWVRNAVG